MFALLLLLLLQSARCDTLYQRSAQLLSRTTSETPTRRPPLADQLAAAARETLACYGTEEAERRESLLVWETYALLERNRYADVLQRTEIFFEQFGSRTSPERRSYMYQERGHAQQGLGNLLGAIRDFTAALEHAPDPSPRSQAALHLQIGVAYQRMNDFEPAAGHFRRAEAVLRGEGGQHRASLAAVLRSQADLLLQQADLTGGIVPDTLARVGALAREAVLLYRSIGEPHGLGLALIKEAEALAHLDHLEQARPLLQEARRLGAGAQDTLLLMKASYKLGRLEMQARAYAAARPLLEESLELARALQDLDYRRRITNELGLLLEVQEAWPEAADWYRHSADLTELYRASLGATAWSAVAFSYWQQPYRGLVRVLLAQGQTTQAFGVLERTRARHLRDLRHTAGGRPLPARGRAQADSLMQALVAVRNERLHSRPQRSSEHAAAETRLLAQLQNVLGAVRAPDTLSLSHLQQALGQDRRVLISYFLDAPEEHVTRRVVSYAFVITGQGLYAVPLATSAPRLRPLLERVNPILFSGRTPEHLGGVQFDLRVLAQLYDLLFAPLARFVPAGAPLTFVPDGALYLLPFSLLVAEAPLPYAYREAAFLLRRHPISVEAAASLLTEPSPERHHELDLAAFGRSTFPEAAGAASLQAGGVPAFDLPAVPEELRVLRRLFGRSVVALDEAATEAALYTRMQQASVLHLASHVTLHPALPRYHALHLSPDSTAPEFDGVVHLHELQPHALTASLVVLSGCNTARGPLRTGEGMQGLQLAFRAMGAQSLLATHWPAADAASVPLMASFYRYLRQGLPKDEALRWAQLEFLDEAPANLQSPFFWAAPVLYGDSRPLSFHSPAKRLAGGWVTALLCSAVLFLLILLRTARSSHATSARHA